MIGERTIQFSVEAIPDGGPGFGGQSLAAHGKVEVQTVPAGATGAVVGTVDTIASCERTGGVLTAVISGSVAGQRFTATVTDRGEAAADDGVVVAGGMTFGPVTVAHGSVQVHSLDACHTQCGEGLCWCYDNDRCEACGEADTTPPPPVTAPTPPPPPPPPAPPLQP
jgi:hypothetical protein